MSKPDGLLPNCHEGCDLWTNAIASSSFCHDVCEEDTTIFKKKSSLYCVRGCNIAINLYIQSLEEEIGTPAAPYLVAETRTNSSITIEWTAASPYLNISYLVQYRYSHSSDWEYYKPHNLLKDNWLKVEDLHPYTKYRVRLILLLHGFVKSIILNEKADFKYK
ncbi:uncharacterized protein LOC118196708 [Stegodyphus dumicola]|uniref:uncharacterized protein LOC118196708 n=1 Tax=Stegodyphus dumicola TaxID=202533 RepID=UPI0015B1F744|nr:uncharacterized protein LOC118196708 [Stegodyphus dumicola]